MQNKRDQVQAHMFLMGRLTSGMLRSDPDAPESPQGRTNRGVVIGIIVAILVATGAFVFGLISPGTTDSWRSSGDLIVDKSTGARYLFLEGRLRPVRNYASARLLAGEDLSTTTVGGGSLKGTPHGAPIGIEGAPDEIPAAGDLSVEPWQVCATSETDASGAVGSITTLAVSNDVGGEPLGKDQAVLVTAPGGTGYLLWQGSRLRLDRTSTAPEALGYASVNPIPVSAAFLNALPAGPDLAPPDNPGRGDSGPTLGDQETRIGQVFKLAVPGSNERHYLLRKDGLVPLSATEMALVLGDPATRQEAYGGAPPEILGLTSPLLKNHLAPGAKEYKGPGASPENPPKAVAAAQSQSLCARVTPQGKGTRVGVVLVTSPNFGPVAQHSSGTSAAACLPVDRVTVPPGHGSLVRAVGAGGGNLGGTLYLVTETGVKYRLATQEAVDAMGYQATEPKEVPLLMLAMLPTGPDLSPQAAQTGRAAVTPPRCTSPSKGDN
ncbi:type VII secretion protein EccB (plasmid) [Streptomyces chartreusis]|uniref:type VII secretion protein EccB n=1 Tax=Streptomyces chartreusis TaxID=1969 RepID=UPI002F91AC6D|nr:type VII secretion protein EccB [Streptomyces chartreusis]